MPTSTASAIGPDRRRYPAVSSVTACSTSWSRMPSWSRLPRSCAHVNGPDGVDVVSTRAPLLSSTHGLLAFYERLATQGLFGVRRTVGTWTAMRSCDGHSGRPRREMAGGAPDESRFHQGDPRVLRGSEPTSRGGLPGGSRPWDGASGAGSSAPEADREASPRGAPARLGARRDGGRLRGGRRGGRGPDRAPARVARRSHGGVPRHFAGPLAHPGEGCRAGGPAGHGGDHHHSAEAILRQRAVGRQLSTGATEESADVAPSRRADRDRRRRRRDLGGRAAGHPWAGGLRRRHLASDAGRDDTAGDLPIAPYRSAR